MELGSTHNLDLPHQEIDLTPSNLQDTEAFIGKKLMEASLTLDARTKPRYTPFWTIKAHPKREPAITIRMEKFFKFLKGAGFYKLYQGKSKLFVRVENNIIRESSVDQIKDFVRTYVENLPELIDQEYEITREDLLEKI